MEKDLEFAEAEKNKALQDLHAAHADITELLAEKWAFLTNGDWSYFSLFDINLMLFFPH